MPFINLIEEERLARKRAEQKTRFAFLGFSASLGLSVFGVGVLLFMNEALGSEVSKLRSESQKQAPLLSEIEANSKALSNLTPRLSTLEDAQEATNRWSDILNHLTNHTPIGVTLTGLRCVSSDPTKPIEANFTGISNRLDIIGESILRLQGCERLENVNLRFAQERTTGEVRNIEFEINSQLAGTAEQKPKDESKNEGSN
ncbi:MAG: hypothetical protein KF784_12000 [Fimbriimonadaceae bacterium]|nr:hypothetical protein [Fimbriimonadaceae bacterium]